MDFLVPVLGSVTGIEAEMWPAMGKVLLRALVAVVPFVVLGLVLERDFGHPQKTLTRVLKLAVMLLFTLPPLLFVLLNHFSGRIPATVMERFPVLETLLIVEGDWSAPVLIGFIILFMVLYAMEVLGGDITK